MLLGSLAYFSKSIVFTILLSEPKPKGFGYSDSEVRTLRHQCWERRLFNCCHYISQNGVEIEPAEPSPKMREKN
jgi:hypothetical protein